MKSEPMLPKNEYVLFASQFGMFAYLPEVMQLYEVENSEPQWERPLLSGRSGDLVEPDYVKATISVVTGCNLGCTYCVYGQLPSAEIRMMSPETGRAIIDYLLQAFDRSIKRITLSFTSNGEPSINLDAIESIKEYCRSKTAAGGPEFRFNFATNAIVLSTERLSQYLIERDQTLFFSVDGPPHLHNCLRVTRAGIGSYDQSLQKIAFYRRQYEQYSKGFSSSTVLTARDEHFDEILLHLNALGFEYIVMRPIRGAKDDKYALNQATLSIFQNGYARMIDAIESRALTGDIALLHKVCNRYDFFGRLLSALLLGEKRIQGCPGCPPQHSDIARYSLVFDTDGKVYFPCRDFIGREEFSLGSVFTNVDLNRARENMLQACVTERKVCRDCWARDMCGGSCYNAALTATGTIREPDPDLCELTRYLAERALKLVQALYYRQPQFLPILTKRAIDVSPWSKVVS